ncbi:hypothetical protein HY745_02330, partial [Candidatus Desantisbacteria bacterium]|nr:hypothetical protein [Candidatus Desantisbacteria bacterium]
GNTNIYAVSEENVVTYSFRIAKETMNLIASDRFGDQNDDFTDEILKKNNNLSKFQIIHKGSEITFIINFNTFVIEKGDPYMLDKAFKLPIIEEITFDKYLMYRMVAKDYQPNAEDTQNIINKNGHKITIGKILDEYEIIFKMKFRIDVDAILKNDHSRSWIIDQEDTSLSSPPAIPQESTSLVQEEKTDKTPSSDLKDISKIARSYLDAQKKKEEEDSKLKKEENERVEAELKEKAQAVMEMKRREEAIKKMARQKELEEEEKQKKENEKKKLEAEKKRKEEETIAKRKKEEEILMEQAKLVIEIQKKEQERKDKEIRQSETEKKTMEKRANERKAMKR